MFECMEISKSIYEGEVEPSYKKPTREDANRAVHSRQNTGEDASSWNLPKKGDISGNSKKRHLDIPTGKSKICLIHGPGYSSEECKVLGDFGTKYAKSRPTKGHSSSPVPRKRIKRHQENKSIVNNAVDEILLTQKVSATNHEALEFLDSDYDAKDLYEVEKMSLEETEENIDWIKRAFEYEKKNSYGIENRNDMTHMHNNELNNIAE